MGGVPIPNVLEVTFAARARYTFKDFSDRNEMKLQSTSNYPNRAPLYLGGFC
jgi:hypothetical protein